MCSGLKYSDDKVSCSRFKTSLGDGDLEGWNLTRDHKILNSSSITRIELPGVSAYRVSDRLSPRSIRHGHKPLRICHVMCVTWVWLLHVRVVGTWQKVVKSTCSQNERTSPIRVNKMDQGWHAICTTSLWEGKVKIYGMHVILRIKHCLCLKLIRPTCVGCAQCLDGCIILI